MYHHVNPIGDFVNVKPDVFEKQIQYLKKHGFTAINSDDLFQIIKGEKASLPKPVMITFDDGWLDNWIYAFPILKKYEMKAVIFIITSLIPENGRRLRADEGNTSTLPEHKECLRNVDAGNAAKVMLSWEEMREMEASGLIDIQSHTHTHKRWDKLYSDSRERIGIIAADLMLSKKTIEDNLGKNCDSLCWPWGVYDKDYISAAQSSGYKMLFTAEKGTNTLNTDLMRIKRLAIGNISLTSFSKKLFIHSNIVLSKTYLKYFK